MEIMENQKEKQMQKAHWGYMGIMQGLYVPLSKLLVSPLISPIVVPHIIPYITPFKEFRL